MGTIDIKGRDLVDTEEIKKRWKEYMEELYEKSRWTDDSEDVVSHPEPDILGSDVKWALDMWTQGLFISMYDKIHYK